MFEKEITIEYKKKKYIFPVDPYLSIHHMISDLYKMHIQKSVHFLEDLYLQKMIEDQSYFVKYNKDGNNYTYMNLDDPCGLQSAYILEIDYNLFALLYFLLDSFYMYLLPLFFANVTYVIIQYLYRKLCDYEYQNIFFDTYISKMIIGSLLLFYIYGIISICLFFYQPQEVSKKYEKENALSYREIKIKK